MSLIWRLNNVGALPLVLVQNVHNNIILEVNGVGTVIMEWHGGFGGEMVVQCPMHGGFGP